MEEHFTQREECVQRPCGRKEHFVCHRNERRPTGLGRLAQRARGERCHPARVISKCHLILLLPTLRPNLYVLGRT